MLSQLDWYYKRYKIVGILTATELYMLTDKSPDFKETYGFLDRLLASTKEGEDHLTTVSMGLHTLWNAKNGLIEMMKDPVPNPETVEMKEEYLRSRKGDGPK